MTNLKQLTTQYHKEHNERIEELKKLIIKNSTNEEFIEFIKEINPSADGVYDHLMEIVEKEIYKVEVGNPLPFNNDDDVGGDSLYIELMHLDEEGIPQHLYIDISVDDDNIVDSIEHDSYWE